ETMSFKLTYMAYTMEDSVRHGKIVEEIVATLKQEDAPLMLTTAKGTVLSKVRVMGIVRKHSSLPGERHLQTLELDLEGWNE
ncbi:unnamed protein product, partial [marine sediment metagenome]